MNAAALVEALEFAVFFNDSGIDVRRMVQIREHAPVVHGLQQLYAQQPHQRQQHHAHQHNKQHQLAADPVEKTPLFYGRARGALVLLHFPGLTSGSNL